MKIENNDYFWGVLVPITALVIINPQYALIMGTASYIWTKYYWEVV